MVTNFKNANSLYMRGTDGDHTIYCAYKGSESKWIGTAFRAESREDLEKIAFKRYSSLKKIKEYLINLQNPIFVRMTGSGSALVSYYYSKKQCDKAQKKFIKDHKKYWCINSKTI